MFGKVKISLIEFLLSFSLLSILIAYSLPEFQAMKYGSPPTPYDDKILKQYKIKGVVRSKSDNKPVKDQKIFLNYRNLETITGSDGSFSFELYNIRSGNFQISVPATQFSEMKTFEVKFEKAPSGTSYIVDTSETAIEIAI